MIFKSFLLTALLVLAADAPKSQINPGIEADIAAIKKVREAAVAAQNANDPDALVDLFTEDIVWMGDGEPTIIGQDAVRAHFRPRFQQFRVEGMTISHDERGGRASASGTNNAAV